MKLAAEPPRIANAMDRLPFDSAFYRDRDALPKRHVRLSRSPASQVAWRRARADDCGADEDRDQEQPVH